MNNKDTAENIAETALDIAEGVNEVSRRFREIIGNLPNNATISEHHPAVKTMMAMKVCHDAMMRALDATEGKRRDEPAIERELFSKTTKRHLRRRAR